MFVVCCLWVCDCCGCSLCLGFLCVVRCSLLVGGCCVRVGCCMRACVVCCLLCGMLCVALLLDRCCMCVA